MHKFVFFVPTTYLEQVKNAVFAAGAGRLGNYDRCAWQTLGQGQFRPLAGSHPHLGEIDQLERVDEYRVEVICPDDCVTAVINALRKAHPYEEPAYDIWRLADV
jgi:hypothetical protein